MSEQERYQLDGSAPELYERYLVPAVTAVIAWALFDEELNLLQVAGMALTTFGVGLATARGPQAGSASAGRTRDLAAK